MHSGIIHRPNNIAKIYTPLPFTQSNLTKNASQAVERESRPRDCKRSKYVTAVGGISASPGYIFPEVLDIKPLIPRYSSSESDYLFQMQANIQKTKATVTMTPQADPVQQTSSNVKKSLKRKSLGLVKNFFRDLTPERKKPRQRIDESHESPNRIAHEKNRRERFFEKKSRNECVGQDRNVAKFEKNSKISKESHSNNLIEQRLKATNRQSDHLFHMEANIPTLDNPTAVTMTPNADSVPKTSSNVKKSLKRSLDMLNKAGKTVIRSLTPERKKPRQKVDASHESPIRITHESNRCAGLPEKKSHNVLALQDLKVVKFENNSKTSKEPHSKTPKNIMEQRSKATNRQSKNIADPNTSAGIGMFYSHKKMTNNDKK